MTDYVTFSAESLKRAGYEVRPTDIPGLWDIDGLARDVTTGQLHDLARRHGGLVFAPRNVLHPHPGS